MRFRSLTPLRTIKPLVFFVVPLQGCETEIPPAPFCERGRAKEREKFQQKKAEVVPRYGLCIINFIPILRDHKCKPSLQKAHLFLFQSRNHS